MGAISSDTIMDKSDLIMDVSVEKSGLQGGELVVEQQEKVLMEYTNDNAYQIEIKNQHCYMISIEPLLWKIG